MHSNMEPLDGFKADNAAEDSADWHTRFTPPLPSIVLGVVKIDPSLPFPVSIGPTLLRMDLILP